MNDPKGLVLWAAVALSTFCTLTRALRIFIRPSLSYVLSAVAYVVFIALAANAQQRWMNVAYLGVSVMGAYRWSQTRRGVTE